MENGRDPFVVPYDIFLAMFADKVRDKTDRGVD